MVFIGYKPTTIWEYDGDLMIYLGKFDHDRTLFSLTGIIVFIWDIIPKLGRTTYSGSWIIIFDPERMGGFQQENPVQMWHVPSSLYVSPPVMSPQWTSINTKQQPIGSQKLPETCLMRCVCSDFLMLFVLWILMVLRIMIFFWNIFEHPKNWHWFILTRNQRLRGWRTKTATSWRTRGGFGRLERNKNRVVFWGIETSEMEV